MGRFVTLSDAMRRNGTILEIYVCSTSERHIFKLRPDIEKNYQNTEKRRSMYSPETQAKCYPKLQISERIILLAFQGGRARFQGDPSWPQLERLPLGSPWVHVACTYVFWDSNSMLVTMYCSK
eukprot:sb/3475833/